MPAGRCKRTKGQTLRTYRVWLLAISCLPPVFSRVTPWEISFCFIFTWPGVFFRKRRAIHHTHMCTCHIVCVHLQTCLALTYLCVQGWGLSLNCLPASPDSTITLPGCPLCFSLSLWTTHTHTHTDSWPSARIHVQKTYPLSPHTWHNWYKNWKTDFKTYIQTCSQIYCIPALRSSLIFYISASHTYA